MKGEVTMIFTTDCSENKR